MRITALLENTTRREDMAVEHGLSLYLETQAGKILFDMGQSGRFAQNAEALGIDLGGVDLAVLSHGHYDHGGGLGVFLERNRKAQVFVSPWAFEPHYHGPERFIGLDPALEASGRLRKVWEKTEIAPGLTLYPCGDCPRPYGLDSGGLLTQREGRLIPEDFRHEQALLVEETGARVLFSGCSHTGVENLTAWLAPDVLVGGFHFSKRALDGKLEARGAVLEGFPTEYYTCHCTGREQYEFLKKRMSRLHYLSCGGSIGV